MGLLPDGGLAIFVSTGEIYLPHEMLAQRKHHADP